MSVMIKPMEGLTFGCDPELFVVDSDGNAVCADGLIPGTKEEPYPVPGGAVQVDGMAAEFNIDPASTYEEFNDNCNKVMGHLRKMLPKGHRLVATPSMQFSEKVWEEAPDHAKLLGCSPDYNAWETTVNLPPDDSLLPRTRTASGHLHIGWTEDADTGDMQYVAACCDLVRQLDWYLGAWSLSVDHDTVRRKLYGKAGAMRFKPYGVEYRVLSNFWLTESRYKQTVWNRMQRAIWDMSKRYMPDRAGNSCNLRIRECIDNSQPVPNDMRYSFSYPITTINR